MKLFYISSVAQQLMQSRSLHLRTPHQGGKLLPARSFPSPTSLSSITNLPVPDKTHILYMLILLHPSLCPMSPALFSLFSLPEMCCVIAHKTPLSSLHTHLCIFESILSASSNIDFYQYTSTLVPFLTLLHQYDTNIHILHSSLN